MNKETEEKVKKEIKQIGIDVVIFLIIIALIGGVCIGAIVW